MYQYLTLGSNDMQRSKRFYDAIGAALGFVLQYEGDIAQDSKNASLGYGPAAPAGEKPKLSLWIVQTYDGKPATFGNGVTVVFDASSVAQVQAFHAAALAAGGSDEGAPGYREHYAPDFYAAYVRDPEGNKLAVVFRDPSRR
jgi:catechol 2,3-dioxygenase-like lactoylglutathione lyase family enzyme